MSIMKKRFSSTDGFVVRKPNAHLGSPSNNRRSLSTSKAVDTFVVDGKAHKSRASTNASDIIQSGQYVDRQEIDDSLRKIGSEKDLPKKNSRRSRKDAKRNKPRSKIKRIIKWTLILLLIAALGIVGYVAFKALSATGSVLSGSIFDVVQTQPLKQDANGRSNFLIVGTTDDDPNHAGGNLTDSILILSVDQTQKNAFIFSIPRDLYVNYGMACTAGYKGKINSYFSCSNDKDTDAGEQDRLSKTQAFIGDIIGMDIQYGIHVRSSALPQAVNAVGGIDVDIEGSNGAAGILDRNFDWGCNYTCYKVKYTNGIHHLDGEQASFLSMARGDTAPTYGLANSNFDREKNQQKILIALKQKAASTGTLTNISKVTGLLDAFGNNIRTNIVTKEIRTLMGLANDTPVDKIKTVDLYKDGEAQFTTKTIDGAGSVVLPAAGQDSYSTLQAYLNKIITQEPFVVEVPHVTVLNGSGTAGMAQTEADKLIAKGFTVDTVGNADDGTYPAVTIYQINAKKPLSAAKLKSMYGVTLKTTTPPVSVVGDTDFLIIIGPAQ